MKDRAKVVMTAVLVLLVIGGAFIEPAHPVFPWHQWPGYMAVIGLLGCIVVVLGSKWLGKHFLQRPEDYDVR